MLDEFEEVDREITLSALFSGDYDDMQVDDFRALARAWATARKEALPKPSEVDRVALVLFRKDALSPGDWPEGDPVTWGEWQSLLIESEREEYREAARQIIEEIQEGQR